MNMKSNVKRYLAALLTVIMIFQQSGANAIFASSENIPAVTTTEEVAVQSEEPAESEPVPQAEEEQQPEQTPEAEPEQTPETTPEETPAPEVTPETTPEVTETPEETPAPEVTEAPEETPTPEVTETPEETPKTDFTYEDSRVAITAKAEEGANLPQDAELRVEYLQDTDPEKYNTELNELNNLLGVDNEKITADYLFYDIYFTSESAGGRIEPAAGTVKVQMQYATPQLEKNTDDESCQSTLKVYVNRKEDTTAEFEKNETDAVKSVKFKTSEMGVVALTRVTTVLAEERTITYQDDEKTIVAVVSDSKALPEDATLVVDEVQLSDEQKELAENSLDSSEQMNDYTAYDMHFEKDGVEVEPQNATVTVSIQFNEVKEIGDETVNQEASKIQVLHLDDDSNVSDVTKDVAVDEEGNVKSAEFVTDNFSIFILAQTVENNRKFVYEDDNVKITAVADKKEEVLNSNLVRMRVEILDDPNSEEYKKIEEVLKEEYKKDNKVLLGFRYYDFTFLKGEEEVEPTEKVKISIERKNTQLPESIPEGLVNDVEIYHVSDNDDTISAEKLSAKIEDNNKNAMVKGNFQMDSFSGVTETYGANGTSMSRSQIVSDLGIAQNFAVFATNFNNDNHMEGAIAVQHFLGNSSSLGNTDQVYNYTTKFDLVIKKKANGDAGKNKTFRFGIFKKQGDTYQQASGFAPIEVTTNDQGEGISDVISHDKFEQGQKYYIFELDDNNNPIINGEGTVNGVKSSVSYSTNGLSGAVVESVGNTSYIEFLEGDGGSTDLVQGTGKGKASLIIGSTNQIGWHNSNQGFVAGASGNNKYSINSGMVDVTIADEPFPIDFSTEMSNLSTLSGNLAKMIPAESGDVKTVYVPIDSSGNVDYQNVIENGNKIFSDNNAWNNNGVNTDGKLLVFNVDCSAAGGSVNLQGCKIDGNDPQSWNKIANSVIWNFYTKNGESYSAYTGNITYKGGLGTLLAPRATVECTSSTNGSVIASSVSHSTCEIHHIKVTDVVNVVKKTVSCTNTPNKGTLTVTKTVAGNGGDKSKEFAFTVELNDSSITGRYGDIEFTNGVATFTLKDGESKTAENLPEGTEYTVTENDYSGDGYTTAATGTTGKISKNVSLVAAFTNTKNTETVDVSGTKTWNDGNNQDGKRPGSIVVNLLANGIEKVSKKVTAEDDWKYSFTNLPKYADGQPISYTVTEDGVEDYQTTISGYDITNSYTPGKTSITVTKAWLDNNDQDGRRPQDIKVQLYAGEDKCGEEVTLNTGNNWSYIWTGLNEKKAGTVISYSVKEVNVPEGYTSTVSGDAKNGFTITNSHTPETTQVSGTKTWNDGNNQDGKRPGSITVNLLANGTKIDSKTVTEKENWKYIFTNLPKYENGKGITYTITEDAVADYSTEVKGYNITNSYTPGKTSVTVTKKWVDNDNKSGKRPSEIKVQLYADGKESGSPVTLNEANKWTCTWSGLDEKRSGNTIVYTVKEVGTVDGYETSVSGDARAGYTITNTLKSGTLEIVKSITGAVSDSTLTADQKAAMTFTVTGPDGYSQTVHYSDFTDGKYTFSNLPLGEYTVTETNADIEGYKLTTTYSVDGGKATVTSKETATVTITNNYTTNKKTSVKISKVDAETYKVLGGAHLMVIDPDGNVVDEWDSTKNAHKITGLKPGVTYTLRETKAPKGYDVAADTTFELNEDGTINTANTTTSISGDDLLVKDEKTVDKTVSVSVTKRLVTVDGQVIGAPDATYYVALYSDPDCTQRVSDVMALNYKNASVSTVTFTGLKKGQTYYVGECEADGTSYLANVNADGTLYTVDFSDGNTVEVTNNDGSKTIYFDNQFEKVPDGYYKEGELNITKKLVGGDGKAKNSSEIFYAGIFSDADFTQLSPDVSDNIVPLDLAGGSEVTSQVKVSIPESGSITLYVTEVDSEGNPVAGAASFKYDVSVDNMQVTFDDDNISADVVITNSENTPEVTPTPTTTTPNTPVTQSGSTTKSAVKTGDSTPIGMFVGLFAAAAVIAGAAVFFKRRKK